jgi:hypothetical protein
MDRKQAEEPMIELLIEWVHQNRPALEKDGVHLELELGPPHRLKRGSSLLLQSDRILAQLLLWDTGEAELEVLDPIADTFLLSEHRDLKSEAELREALSTLVEAVTSRSKAGHA